MKWETILKIGFCLLNENRQVEYGLFLFFLERFSPGVGNLILSKPFTYVGTWFQLGHWPCNLTSRLLQATSPWLMSMPRSTSILHRAKACNECRTSGVRDKGYCSQLFESPWTTVITPLYTTSRCREALGCGTVPRHPVQPAVPLQKKQSSD